MGKQIVLEDERYSLHHPLFPEKLALLQDRLSFFPGVFMSLACSCGVERGVMRVVSQSSFCLFPQVCHFLSIFTHSDVSSSVRLSAGT